jgi:O-antigen/teichoic acid export membrane protein
MLVSNLGKVLLQGTYFVVAARTLGAEDFGVFASLVALAAIVAPFASLGTMQLMIRNVAQGRGRVASQFTTSLTVTAVCAVMLGAVLFGTAPWIASSRASPTVVVLVLLADLFCARIVEVVAAAFQSARRMSGTAYSVLTMHLFRLLAALMGLLGVFEPTLLAWTVSYCLGSLLAMALVVAYAASALGTAMPVLATYRHEAGEGLLFSVGLASQTVYNDIDKAMLGRLSTAASVGLYTAAGRVVDTSLAPLRALLGAASPRFFARGAEGLDSCLRYAGRLAIPGIGYCLTVSVGLYTLADFLPSILGDSFADAPSALRGLAFVPVLKAIQHLLADSLTAAGYQGRRTAAQLSVAGVNFGLNLWLIPLYSWRGAVAATIASEVLLLLALCTITVLARHREHAARRGAPSVRTSNAA